MTILWTEKYRPKDLESFESLEHIKNFLKSNKPNDFPNLLLYGAPGTGKTTFAHLLASDNKLELNASDERGINVIRDKIKLYASTLTPNKTIILDECENLTDDAQHCLRRIIEDSKNTRFIFTTNYLSKVIGPLKSRLVKIKFEIQKNDTLKKIGQSEKLNFPDEFYDDVFKKCNYDLRRSINVIQGLSPFVRMEKGNCNMELVDEVIGLVPDRVINKFLSITRSDYKKFISDFIDEGYPVLQFIQQLTSRNTFQDDYDNAKFNLMLSKMESKLIVGCSDELVLTKICLSKIN